jgi:hypothetical protein
MSDDGKLRVVGRTAYFGGMAWPLPDDGDDDEPSVEWTLRYGEPSREDLLAAASILSAYRALVTTSSRQRAYVVRMLRWAEQRADDSAAPGRGAGGT